MRPQRRSTRGSARCSATGLISARSPTSSSRYARARRTSSHAGAATEVRGGRVATERQRRRTGRERAALVVARLVRAIRVVMTELDLLGRAARLRDARLAVVRGRAGRTDRGGTAGRERALAVADVDAAAHRRRAAA